MNPMQAEFDSIVNKAQAEVTELEAKLKGPLTDFQREFYQQVLYQRQGLIEAVIVLVTFLMGWLSSTGFTLGQDRKGKREMGSNGY